MSGFDLNSPIGFAQATMSPVSLLLSELTGLNPAKWDIVECSYSSNADRKILNAKPIYFLVFQSKQSYQAGMASINDMGGRRKAKFVYPYKDGQTTDDLGAKPGSFDLNCMFHGPNYKQAIENFLLEASQPSPGILTHPVRGQQAVVLEDWEITHQCQERQACTLRVRFIEHSFDIDPGSDTAKDTNRFKTALMAALSAVNKINAAITKVQSTAFAARQIAQRIQMVLNLKLYSEAFVAMLQALNATFNFGSSSDLPSLLPVQEGGIGNDKAVNTFPVVKTPNDPFIGIQTSDPSTVPVFSTAQAVDKVNALRAQADLLIQQMESTEADVSPGQGANVAVLNETAGALVFYSEILSIKETAVLMQGVLEAGIATSQETIQDFTTQRVMSIREVAFAVGLQVDDAYQIELLNPSLLSANFIPQGTTLQVPVPA